MWGTELVTVRIPEVAGMRQVKRRFQNDNIHQSELKHQVAAVALENLDVWRFNEVVLQCRYNKKFHGERTVTRREKIHLPSRRTENPDRD